MLTLKEIVTFKFKASSQGDLMSFNVKLSRCMLIVDCINQENGWR